MLPSAGLTTEQVLTVFTEAITAHGGQVIDTFDDGRRLFTRSVLPHVEDVRSGDRHQGGVALRATEGEVRLHPYLFRLVCRNGAIMAQALETRCLADLHLLEPEEAIRSLREGVEACCAEEVFRATVHQVRKGCETEADLTLNLAPLLTRLTTRGNLELVSAVLDQFFREGDSSRFGLTNAVTAIARDTRDPELRWELEEFGGGIAIGAVPERPVDGGACARARRDRAVMVG